MERLSLLCMTLAVIIFRSSRQVEQLNKSVWNVNSTICSTTLLESAHNLPIMVWTCDFPSFVCFARFVVLLAYLNTQSHPPRPHTWGVLGGEVKVPMIVKSHFSAVDIEWAMDQKKTDNLMWWSVWTLNQINFKAFVAVPSRCNLSTTEKNNLLALILCHFIDK